MNIAVPEPNPVDAIAQHAARGVLWTYLSFAGSKLLIFAATVVLARLLVPNEFGQIGFALLVIGYIDTVGDFGISSALIYEKDRKTEAADVAFIVSIVAGLFWFLIAYALAPLAALFFKDPAVVPIMRMLALSFVINALGNTQDAILRRDLAFRKRLLPDFAMALFKGVISIALAFAGWGVWSLVWGQLIGALAAVMALWWVVPWRPGFSATWHAARRMVRYGSHISSVNVVAAIVHDVDFLIVGRLLGATALGLYSLAYRTPEMLITTVIWVIGKVTFPVYSKLRDDPKALTDAFLVTLRYLSLLTLPAGLGLAFLCTEFVNVFFGKGWADAILAMQALAISGALRSLGSHAGDVYKATGRPIILTKLGMLRAAVLIPAMIWGARYGISGVAIAQMIVTGLSTILNLHVAGRILNVPTLDILREFRTSAACCLIMILVLAMTRFLMTGLPDAVVIGIQAGIGATVYLGAVFLIDRKAVRQVRQAFAPVGSAP